MRWIVYFGLLAGALNAQQAPKKRVAVLNFDYATVQSGVSAVFGQNLDIGKGIADILVERLVTGGVYSVIERKAIDKIMAEQNFSNSDRADPNSAAKIGRILGVDSIIVGSITQFGRDDKTTSVGGGAIGGLTGKYGLGGVGKRQAKAVVAITARMINTDTGEILGVASGKGESNRGGATLLGAGGSSAGSGRGAYDMTSQNFADTIIGEAVTQAVAGVASQLQASAGKLPTRTVNIDALVADATGGMLVINAGTRGGIKVGDKLLVRRPIREIKDPATGKVIRQITDTIGEVVITEADDQSSVGKFTGGQPAKVGDQVRNQ